MTEHRTAKREDWEAVREELLVYHFKFGLSYGAGCPVNSSIADSFDSLTRVTLGAAAAVH